MNGARETASGMLARCAREVLSIAAVLMVAGVSGALLGEREPPGSARDHALWRSFVETVGADECGYADADPTPLKRALAATREEAERHFMADGQRSSSDERRTAPYRSGRSSAIGP